MINKVLLTALLLLCVIAPKAQNLFDLPFINENTEPELYFLDPNYNKDHQVEYYSLGDILKVQYEYNTQRQPIKKTLYTRKSTNEWEKTLVTIFTYHDGHLVDEQTSQFYENKPIYTLSKTITRHKNEPIDTVRRTVKWWEKQFQSRMEINIPESYTVRYLNKYQLPDSILQVFTIDYNPYIEFTISPGETIGDTPTDSDPFTTDLIKQYFIYNKDQKIIEGKARRQIYIEKKEEEQPWFDLYTYKIKYDNNKITYTQIINTPDVDADGGWTDLKYHIDINDKKNEVTTYTLVTDNNNRLLSKQLICNNKQILHSQYDYTLTGKTNVTMELSLNPQFMEKYGSSEFNRLLGKLVNEMEDIKCVVSHADNFRTSTVFLKNRLVGTMNTCYLPNGKLLSEEFIRYENGELDHYENGELADHDKDTYQYLDNGMIEKTRFIHYRSEGLQLSEKHLYKKDSLDRTVYEEILSYNYAKKIWDEKRIYGYDQYGYLALREKYKSRNGKEWQGEDSKSWIRDVSDNILEMQGKDWKNGAWQNDVLERYAYDENSQETLRELYRWDINKKEWKGRARGMFYTTKIDSTQTIGEISFTWLDGKWEFAEKKETEKEGYTDNDADKNYKYNAKNGKWEAEYHKDLKEKKTSYEWEQNKWVPKSERITKKGKFDSFFSSSEWDKATSTWRLIQQDKEWRRGDTSYVENYLWSENDDQLTGRENTMTVANQDNDIMYKLFKIWDEKDRTYKNFIAYHETRLNDSTMLFRYDQYNETKHQWEFDRKVEAVEKKDHDITMTQSRWNGIDWVFDYKTVSFDDDETDRVELYTYQTANKVWLPLYCTVYDAGKSYLKWDQKNKKWAKHLLQKGLFDYSQWNESLQKYVESATAYEKALAIDAEFEKINLETDYNIVYR